MKKNLQLLATLVCFTLGAGSLQAATKTWQGANNALYSVSGSWNPSGQPVNGDSAIFPNLSSRNVSFGNGNTARMVEVTVNAGANTYTFNRSGTSGNLLMETTGGTISISSGTLIMNTTTISGAAGFTIRVASGALYDPKSGNTCTGATLKGPGTVRLENVIGLTAGNLTFSNADPSPYNGYTTVDLWTKSPTWGSLNGAGGTIQEGASFPRNDTVTLSFNSASATFGGVITKSPNNNTINLTKTGTGIQTLTASCDYLGNTTISGGSLLLTGSGALTDTPLIVLASGATFGPNGMTMGAGRKFNATGAASGQSKIAGSLTLSSTAVLAMSFDSSVGATVDVPSGTLSLGSSISVVITNTGGNLSPGSYKLISQSGGAVSGSALPTPTVLLPNGTQGWTGDSVNLSVDGNGELYLNVVGGHSQTSLKWSGGSGTWDVEGNTNWKDSGANDVAFYDNDIVTIDETYTSSGGTITVGETVTPASVTVNISSAGYTISGSPIAGTATFTKQGTHTLTLGSANTFTGNTRIGAGSLILGHSSALADSPLDMNSGDTGTLLFTSGLGTATVANLTGSRDLTLADVGSGGVTLIVGGNNQNSTYLGVLSGAGGLTKTGTGTFTLDDGTGPPQTYTGATIINQGKLYIQDGATLPVGRVELASGATLETTATTLNIKGLDGSGGTITKSGNNVAWTLTLGNGDASGSYGGTIQNGSALLSLTKTGSGTQTLSGLNSIGGAGGTTINGGKIRAAGDANVLGALSCTVNSGTLEIVGITLSAQLGLNLNNGATLMASGGTGSYAKSGSPAIASSANVTFATDTSGDTLSIGSAVSGGNASSLITATGPGVIALTTGSGTGFAGTWRLTGGTLRLSNENSLGNSSTKAIELAGGTLETRNTTAVTYSTATSVTANSTVRPNGSGNGTTHDFGPLSINNSTLNVAPGSDITDGSTGTVSFDNTALSGDATFSVTRNGSKLARVVLGAITDNTGGYKVVMTGDDRLQLGGAGTYSGGMTFNPTATTGQLNINNATALGTGTFTIDADGLLCNNTGSALTLTANNPQAWNADFTFGFEGAGNDNLNLGTGAVTLGGHRQVTVGGDVLTVGGAIGDGGNNYTLTKAGTGTLVLGGANTYSGDTTISGGSLLVNGSLAAGSAVTVSSGGVLGGTGIINDTVTVNSGGTLAPGASIGTLTVNDDVTLDSGSATGVEIDRSGPSADLVTGIATLTQGGTLYVTNNGATLQSGDQFTLFSATTYGGEFAAISPANPNSDTELAWDAPALKNTGVLKVHHVPFATNVTVFRGAGLPAKVKLGNLFPTTDPVDSDAVVLDSNTSGSQGATITTSGGYFFYTPANNSSDSFDYTVKDNRGGSRTRTITVTVTESVGSVGITNNGGTAVLTFYGIPGYVYRVQRSCGDLDHFLDLGDPITAPSSGSSVGLVQTNDVPGESCNPAYYRVRQN